VELSNASWIWLFQDPQAYDSFLQSFIAAPIGKIALSMFFFNE
jgi:hypothetical protein